MSERERLDLVANVVDQFDDELDSLQSELAAIDAQIANTGKGGDDEIRIDVDVRTAGEIGKIEGLNAQLERLDDADVDVDVDDDTVRDVGGSRGDDDLFDDFNTIEQSLAEDFIGPFQFQRETDIQNFSASITNATLVAKRLDTISPDNIPDLADGIDAMEDMADGGEAVADGDGDGNRLFTIANIDEFDTELGAFFDEQGLAARGGETSRVDDIVTRDMDDLFNQERILSLARDDTADVDTDIFKRLRGMEGVDEFTDAIDELNDIDPELTRLGGETRDQRIARVMKDIQFTMGNFHQIFAAMVPLLGIFVGALPATITALGGLAVAAVGAAAVLGGIAGLGAIGLSLQEDGDVGLEAVVEELKDVAATFRDAFAPLAHSMVPVFQTFLGELKAMAGPLATASRGLLAFRDEFKNFGAWLGQALPSFTRDFIAFTKAAMPVVQGLFATLADVDIFGALATHLETALPMLSLLGDAILDILPAIIHISQGFLIVAAGLLQILRPVAWLINTFPVLGTVIGVVTASLLGLVTAATLYNVVQTQSIALAGTWIKQLGGAMLAAFSRASAGFAALIAKITGYNLSMTAANILTATLVGLLGILTLGAIAATDAFDNLANSIFGARKELAAFSNEDIGDRGPRIAGGGGPSGGPMYQDNSTTIINADNRDDAIRQQERERFNRQQHVDAVFGGGT